MRKEGTGSKESGPCLPGITEDGPAVAQALAPGPGGSPRCTSTLPSATSSLWLHPAELQREVLGDEVVALKQHHDVNLKFYEEKRWGQEARDSVQPTVHTHSGDKNALK